MHLIHLYGWYYPHHFMLLLWVLHVLRKLILWLGGLQNKNCYLIIG